MRKEVSRQRTSSSCTEMTEEQIHSCIMRILQCSFKKPADHLVFLPNTTESFKTGAVSYADLINQCLMEVLALLSNGTNPFKNLSQPSHESDSLNNFSVSPTQTLSPSPSPGSSCPVSLPFKASELTKPQNVALSYLMESYARVAVEERNHPKRCSIPPLSDVLSDLRAQLVHFTALLLRGFVLWGDSSVSPLLAHLLQQTVPRGFVSELVTRTCNDPEVFEQIFNPILQGLCQTMQNASIVGNEHRLPLQILSELTEIRCGSRPVCSLITRQAQFQPETCTQAAGRELSKTSFLGPFLSVSVFAEDEPKVPEKFFSGNAVGDKSLRHTLQQELEHTRVILHKIFHDGLANLPSRDPTLAYIVALLKGNEKRTQLQMEERSLAGDGFMLNLLSVLQMLSGKVKLDKIDSLYLFHPKAVLDVKGDTKLRFTSQETNEWLEDIGIVNGNYEMFNSA